MFDENNVHNNLTAYDLAYENRTRALEKFSVNVECRGKKAVEKFNKPKRYFSVDSILKAN